ncbi:MAG: AsmA family protein [Kiloniellaceae bacterium]
MVLILLVVGGLLVLPNFWDWNGEKGRIAALVREHTGRDLQIAGDVSLRLLPTPAFSAGEVTLANIEGGSAPAMVRLDELQIRVALAPLLRGDVLVESVTLVRPQVLLEVLADGRANWDLRERAATDAAGDAVSAPSGTGSSAGDQSIRVDSFIVEDGTLRYLDARSGRSEVVENLNAELGAESLVGPFAVAGSADYRDVPLEFDFNLDRFVEDGATAVSLSLKLPEAGASGNFLGALSRHEDLQSLRGRLQAEGEDLARFLRGLPLAEPPRAVPALLGAPFALTAEIAASDNGDNDADAAARAVGLTLGDVSLDGNFAVVFGEVPEVKAELSAKTIDLDKLFAGRGSASAAEGEAQVPAASPPGQSADPASGASAPGESSQAAALALPQDLSGTLAFTADAVLYRGQTVRQVELAARLDKGGLDLERAVAQLPGSSDLSLDGRLTTDGQGPRFAGKVEASSDNLRGLLRWLGADTTRVPAERLRRLAFTTALDARRGQVTLRDIDLSLDVSRMTGGVAIAVRERPGLGIGLAVDRINLDAYLPNEAGPAESKPAAPAAPAPGDPAGQPAAQAADPAAAVPAGLPLLGRFDANLDLRVGQMTYRGLPLNGLRLDATLQRGGLVVRDFSIDDLAGSRGSFAGSLANVDRDPSVDGSLDISVAALSRLAKALGVETGGQLPLESFALSGAVNGNREELRFDQRLTALGGSLHAAGKAGLQPAALTLDAGVELDHPDLSVLLGELMRDGSVPAGLGPVDMTGRVAAGTGDLRLSGLAGEVAGVEILGGEVGLQLAVPRPKVTVDLATGELPLAALAAPGAAAGKTAGGTKGQGAEPAPSSPRSAAGRQRWSNKPFDLAALRGFDAEVKLRAETIVADKARLEAADLEATLADGQLDLRHFNAQAYGGALAVTGKADLRESAPGGLEVALAVNALEVELKDLLRDLAGSERFAGPMSLDGNFNSRGNSEAALIAALSGKGKLDGSVTVAAKVEEQAGALVLELLGKKVKEVRGVTDSTTMLFGAFAGAPAKVDGSFVVEQGVLRSDDLTVRGRNAQALTAGNLDLPDWRLESRTDVFRDAAPEEAYLTAVLRGPIDAPDVRISGQPFQREKAPAATEPPAEPPTAPTEDGDVKQPAVPAKPEELLKEGVKSLLKGLGG